jgi:magnesium-protoporphyrin IX monomethyl ester (oxidative) cyclase
MNIQLLKWAAELGIYVHWSFLANVPGERDEWYAEVAEWLPLISHLQPPMTLSQLRYDRFSPYHQRPADYGLKIRPYRTYSYIYPASPEILAELAYFFEDDLDSIHANLDLPQSIAQRPGLNALKASLETWCEDWRQANPASTKERPLLSMVDSGTHLTLTDTRPCAVDRQSTLSGLAYTIYKACDQALTPQALTQALRPSGCSWADIEPVVADLRRRKLLLALNDRLLSLAVKEPCQPLLAEHPGGEVNVLEYVRLRKLATMVAALS